MNLILNGKPQEFEKSMTLTELLEALALEKERVAVMVNGAIIRRAAHSEHRLADHDAVEIIHMVGGG